MGFLESLLPLAIGSLIGMPQLGLAGLGGAGGAGGLLSSLFGSGAAASLPAATAGAGIANASPDFLSAVGLPPSIGPGAGSASTGFGWGDLLKNGGNFLDYLGKAQQATKPQPLPSMGMPQIPAPAVPAAPQAPDATATVAAPAPAPDPYATSLQKLMQVHGRNNYGF